MSTLKQQKFIVSQFWRREGLNQGASRLSLKALGENLFHAFILASGIAIMLGIPWLVDTSLQSLPLLSHDILPVCLYVSSLLKTTPVILD